MINQKTTEMPLVATEAPEEAPVPTSHRKYTVERILASRVNENGRKEFYIKWLGYGDHENTWEPEEYITEECLNLIVVFEANEIKDDSRIRLNGFAQGLEPEAIIGATDYAGSLMYVMKWRGVDEAELVFSEEANLMCPQTVIKFFEEHTEWLTPQDETDDGIEE